MIQNAMVFFGSLCPARSRFITAASYILVRPLKMQSFANEWLEFDAQAHFVTLSMLHVDKTMNEHFQQSDLEFS